mmetsp:Transcript_19766/g.62224  ORF Transcript_19766/g.62224 Transcript_19766/m.62224 type:complete len:173 (-) Transcript_19766:118-636(-)
MSGVGASKESSLKPSLGSVVRSKLRLLTVCDAENGVVLFERVWQWSEGNPAGLGNLVRSFFQIAKQLDHGMVSRVVFEQPIDDDTHEPRMQMLCTKNREIVVALFYDEDLLYSADEASDVHAAMRQFIEQSRELWRKHTGLQVPQPEVKGDDQHFDDTIDGLLQRILDGLGS